MSDIYNYLKLFIENNKIISRNVLKNNYEKEYRKFKTLLTTEEQDKLLPVLNNNYSKLLTNDDFQEFINKNNIKSNKEFYKKYPSVYNKFLNTISKNDRNLIFEEKSNNDYSSYNTLNDFKEFIDRYKIESPLDFSKRYPGLYSKYIKLISKKDRLSIFPLRRKKVESFKEKADFQNYIDNNEIKSLKEFRKNHKTVYGKYLNIRKNWKIDERGLVFIEESNYTKFKNLNTNKDFQNYINENDIKSRQEFRNNSSLSSRYFKVVPKEQRNLKFENIDHYLYNDEFSSVEDFQIFINDNKIIRPIDFRMNFPKLYDRYCRVISKEDKTKLIYWSDTNKVSRSYGERFLMNLFKDNNIEFIPEKTFSDLKNKSYLRYDLYLPVQNILIEYHGEQHFNKNTLYYSEELLENDKKKYEYAMSHNIHIFYFTLNKSSLKEFGYFTEVITDVSILLQKIKEISLTN